MLKMSVSILACFVMSITTSTAQNNVNDITIGTSHSMKSVLLDETRPYWVHLPPNYNPDEKYPVMYLLDARFHFNYTAGYLDILPFDGKIKQTILVAVPNTNRFRDLTPTHSDNGLDGKGIEFFAQSGGGEKFLNFIKDELVPQIEKDYSTNDFRILAGHSNSGLFTMFAFLEVPHLFQAFIAVDPTLIWDNEILTKRLEEKIKRPPSSKNSIYISSANNENDSILPPEKMKNAQARFVNILSKWKSDSFRVKFEHLEDENHTTSAFVGMLHGLQFSFREQ